MNRFFTSLLISAIAVCSISCSHKSENDEITPAKVDSNEAPADSAIFRLGEREASDLLRECTSISQVEERLLDVRARIHLIDTRISPTAAEDYTKGFTSYIRQNCDTLANIIF